jgi:hypothetical protein
MENTTKKKVVGAAAVIAGVGLGSVAGALFGAPSVSGAATAMTETGTAVEAAGHPGPGPARGRFGHRVVALDAAAEALGMTVGDLRTDLMDGLTLAQVAEAHGVDREALVGALVAAADAHLDEAVADGELTEEEAAERREGIEERVTAMVDGERPGCD